MTILTVVVVLFGGLAALHANFAVRRRSLVSVLSAAYCVALGAAVVDTYTRGTMRTIGWVLFGIGVVLMLAARVLQFRARRLQRTPG